MNILLHHAMLLPAAGLRIVTVKIGHARVKLKPVSVRERVQALNPYKQTCIGKEADVSPQTKQTNLYQCGSEEVALKKFGTEFVTKFVTTRISGRYAPLILAPAQGSTHLHHVLLNNFFSLNY